MKTKYIRSVDSIMKYFATKQQISREPLLQFHGNTQQFYTTEI
jgi:hypothetical protein